MRNSNPHMKVVGLAIIAGPHLPGVVEYPWGEVANADAQALGVMVLRSTTADDLRYITATHHPDTRATSDDYVCIKGLCDGPRPACRPPGGC